jgi:hypothetical protein
LDGVNEVLRRVGVIQGDAGELSSLTNSPRQKYIDTAVQLWNEVVEQLYLSTDTPLPKEQAEGTITLVASDREYALADGLVQLHWPLLDETNGQYITPYPGGFMQMKIDQPYPDNETGLPMFGAINPQNGELHLDKLPTSAEAGRVYTYWYDKDISLSDAADEFPFTNTVFRALVPAVAELWKKEHQNKFNEKYFNSQMGAAARALTMVKQRTSWNPRTVPAFNVTDPFNARQ